MYSATSTMCGATVARGLDRKDSVWVTRMWTPRMHLCCGGGVIIVYGASAERGGTSDMMICNGLKNE